MQWIETNPRAHFNDQQRMGENHQQLHVKGRCEASDTLETWKSVTYPLQYNVCRNN